MVLEIQISFPDFEMSSGGWGALRRVCFALKLVVQFVSDGFLMLKFRMVLYKSSCYLPNYKSLSGGSDNPALITLIYPGCWKSSDGIKFKFPAFFPITKPFQIGSFVCLFPTFVSWPHHSILSPNGLFLIEAWKNDWSRKKIPIEAKLHIRDLFLM